MRALVIALVLAASAGGAHAGGELSATPDVLEFGAVPQGTTVQRTFVLANDGDAPTAIVAPSGLGSGFQIFTWPNTLQPGMQATVTVYYTPAGTTGGDFALAQFGSNAGTVYVSMAGNDPGVVLTCPVCTRFTLQDVQADYGQVGWQATVTQTFTLSNTTASDITVEQLSADDFEFALAGAPTAPFTLPANGSVTFTESTVPGTALGTNLSGNVSVWTDATPGNITVGATLTAQIVTGVAMVLPGSTVDFGPVDIHAPATKTISIENVGLAPISITDWPALTGGVFTSPAVAAVTIPAGGSQSVTVTYQPTAEGTTDTATLVVSIAGVMGKPQPYQQTIMLTGHGADRHLVVGGTPVVFPATFVDPVGPAAPIAQIVLSNTGEAPLTISSVTLAGDPAFALVDQAPTTILGKGQALLHVRFTPTAVGSFTGTLTVLHDDDGTTPTPGRTDIPISGMGTARMIGVSPTGAIDFGGVHLGDLASQYDQGRTVMVTNLDPTRSMTITSVAFLGDDDNIEWAFAPPYVPVPATLEAGGGTAPIALEFLPADVGPRSGALLLYFDGDLQPDVQIPLTGTGLPPRNTYYACSAGGGAGGGLAIALAIGFVIAPVRRASRACRRARSRRADPRRRGGAAR